MHNVELISIVILILVNTVILLQPIFKLNNTITRLDLTLQRLEKEMNEALDRLEQRIKKHGEEIDLLREKMLK